MPNLRDIYSRILGASVVIHRRKEGGGTNPEEDFPPQNTAPFKK